MVRLGVVQVFCSIVIAENNVLHLAILVRHEQVCEPSAITDERGIDALCGNGVFLERVCLGTRRSDQSRTENGGLHADDGRLFTFEQGPVLSTIADQKLQ